MPEIELGIHQKKFPSVMVGIMNHNRSRETVACIKSILAGSYPVSRVVVVDNGSTDDSPSILRAEVPTVEVVAREKNEGPARGRNTLFALAREKQPDYLLLMDNDTVAEKDFLVPLVNAMEEDKDAAVAGGTILEYEHPDRIWYAGGRLVPWRGLAIHEHKGETFNPSSPGKNRRVEFITSCLMLYRGSLLDKIGWQDERYFVYLEDIDHAARIQKMGYKQIYVPESIIYHKVSGERQSTFKLYYSVRSRLLLIREGFGGISGLVASAYFLIVISLKLVVWRLFRPDFFKAASAGLVDYFKGNFGQGRGTTLFPDSRTTVPTRETPVTLTSKGPIGT